MTEQEQYLTGLIKLMEKHNLDFFPQETGGFITKEECEQKKFEIALSMDH